MSELEATCWSIIAVVMVIWGLNLLAATLVHSQQQKSHQDAFDEPSD